MTGMIWLLAADAAYHYVPFLKPAPLWSDRVWYLLALPLCLGIAIVYKTVRVSDMKRLPREALHLFIFIIIVLVACAAGLGLLVDFLQR